VFTSAEGGLLRRSNFTRRVWRPATRAVGLEGLRFHDLRHTSATLSIAAGASTPELMARMGHSSPAAAVRYQHVMAGPRRPWRSARRQYRVACGCHESGTRSSKQR
jgi:integrase